MSDDDSIYSILSNHTRGRGNQKLSIRTSLLSMRYGRSGPTESNMDFNLGSQPDWQLPSIGASSTVKKPSATQSLFSRQPLGSGVSRFYESMRGKRIPTTQHSVSSNRSDIRLRHRLEKQITRSCMRPRREIVRNTLLTNSSSKDLGLWVSKKRTFTDHYDVSSHPSYSIKNVSYHLECNLNYLESKLKYNAQFLREMQYFISTRQRTADEYFTKKLLSYRTCWPPLHTKAELNVFINKFFQLEPEQKRRLNFLMNADLNYI